MCFGLAPGFVLRDEIAEELLEEYDGETSTTAYADDIETETTPSFATEGDAEAEALTGAVAEPDDDTKTPR